MAERRVLELPSEPLRGERVLLRRLAERDIPAYAAAFRDDPALGADAGDEVDPDEATVRRRLAEADEYLESAKGIEFVVTEPGDDVLLGTVVLHSWSWRHERAEVGFWLAPAARGRGIATEAVGLVLDWAFQAYGLHRIEIETLPTLAPVRALAERLGFTVEGARRERNLERGRRLDTLELGLLRSEWGARLQPRKRAI